ncbi:MAG: methylated-DNA--[protein]-cysteine S-methyltransferase [Phascolarctobacterium sp.]|nr:methylated-DNA--[protein]-cysteine S-methyltransferase [Phascolarctobacterium sp.]
MIYVSDYISPIGKITLAATDEGIIGAWIEGQKYFFNKIEQKDLVCQENEELRKAKAWLDDYFAGKKPELTRLKLAPKGSEFAMAVWKVLREIPYGETTTYGEIAKKIAEQKGLKRMSAQAVGGAVGHNPISIIVPCHRVVGSNGSLTGYAGGIEIKAKLLAHEEANKL